MPEDGAKPTTVQARALERAARALDRHAEVSLDEGAGHLVLAIGGFELRVATKEEADGVEAALTRASDLDAAFEKMPPLTAMEEPAYEPPEDLSPRALAEAVVARLVQGGDLELSETNAVVDVVARVLDDNRHRSCGPPLLEALQHSPTVATVTAPQAKLRRVVQMCATELRGGVEPSSHTGWQ